MTLEKNKNAEIISYFMRTRRGIRGTARYFGLPKSYVGSIVNKYKKKRGIR